MTTPSYNTGDAAAEHPAPAEPLVQLEAPRRSPHIPRSLDNTALADYMACPFKYYAGMVLHRRRAGAPSPAISAGTAWHAGLEAHFKTGGNRDAVQRAIVMAWEQHDRPEDHRTVERVLASYDQYIDYWGSHDQDAARSGRTVGFPDNPLVEIPVELSWPGALHPYTGRIDRIYEHNGLYYVEDHKSTSQMGTYYFHQFDPDNQMMGYAALAEILTGLPIAGVRINAVCFLKGSTKFAREVISFSKERLAHWRENYNMWVQLIEQAYANDFWPHNFKSCSGKYGACQYTPVCSSSPHRRMQVLEMEYEEKPWEPAAFEEGGAE